MVEEVLETMNHRGITQEEMAEILGISKNTFWNKANAINDFTVSELEKMCDVLGIKFQLFHTPHGWNMEAWRRRRAAKDGRPIRRERKDCK